MIETLLPKANIVEEEVENMLEENIIPEFKLLEL